ncbi:centriolar and ciliogenesis-associated protein HYLS1 isoform X2 [Nerophis ophidion]|nr:centriolar and ciliogenesis-associated protein HYLS1 isoform X2 [Nerophis ophidion]XP_061771323.1 centriolar and ciliogenesis-associated protein HYLS1 isoform X2 [Nerophis ophidion]
MNIKAQEWRPPAFTKEKVSPCDFEASPAGFYLHQEHHQETPPPVSRQPAHHLQGRKDHRWTGGPALTDQEDAPTPTPSGAFIPDTRGRHFIKRKVLRKRGGQSLVCDESVYSRDSDSSNSLHERLSDLHLSPPAEDTLSSMEGVSLSGFESFVTRSTRAGSDVDFRAKPKSFIRPVLTQQTKKTDCVARYSQYKQLWDTFKVPGERDHKELRWEIRERLAYQPPAPKAPRSYVANTYVVPTDKKRSALRWQVRNHLALGGPHQCSY